MARNNPSVGKLLTAMKKHIQEVNDQEICRRLEILINAEKEDLPSQVVRRLLETPESIDIKEIPEPYTQYVRHYLYMIKRSKRSQREGAGSKISSRGKKDSVAENSAEESQTQAKKPTKTVKNPAKKTSKKTAKKTSSKADKAAPGRRKIGQTGRKKA